MRYPEPLKPQGTIGYAAPSFGASVEPYTSAFRHALDRFRKMGYGEDPGPNVYQNDGIGKSSSAKNCGTELTDLYVSSGNDVLLSVGGGETMCEDLAYVDFDAIRSAKPKWFMGYSDNTNFTFLLPTLADTAAIYGPCAPAFGMEPWHPAIQDAFDLLTGKIRAVESYDGWEKESLKTELAPLEPYHVTEPNVLRLENWDKTPFEGRLIGGCLDCLTNLCGTRFDRVKEFAERYQNDGLIWFLEACDLNVFGIRRALWELKEAGWFRYAKGFLIGRPLLMGQELFGLDQYRAVTDMIGELGVPILMDLDIGHLPPMMPLLSGGYAKILRTEAGGLRIEYLMK